MEITDKLKHWSYRLDAHKRHENGEKRRGSISRHYQVRGGEKKPQKGKNFTNTGGG